MSRGTVGILNKYRHYPIICTCMKLYSKAILWPSPHKFYSTSTNTSKKFYGIEFYHCSFLVEKFTRIFMHLKQYFSTVVHLRQVKIENVR